MSEHKHKAVPLLNSKQLRVYEANVEGRTVFEIRMVTFGADDQPWSVSDGPVGIQGKSADDILALLNDAALALSKPSVIASDLPKTLVLPGLPS